MPELEQQTNIEQTLRKVAEQIVESVEKVTGDIEERIDEDVEEIEENIKGVTAAKKVKKQKAEENEAVEQKEAEEKPAKPKQTEKTAEPQLIFGLYDISEVKASDSGLKSVINLNYKLVVKSHGRIREKFGKSNVNIVERLINTISVPGHRGKKHKIVTSWATGKYNKNAKMVLEAFKIIENKTKENPIQILVTAIENGSPKDEVTMIQYGGARYPQAVDCAPLRRISLALRNIVHGAYDKSFRSKKTFPQALADELIATAKNEPNAVAVTKRTELEKQADAAR